MSSQNQTGSGTQTLDQRRAAHAWEAVKDAKSENDKEFKGQAKKIPTRIIAAGLGQALAFLHAKGYSPLLLRVLGDWVLEKRHKPESKAERPPEDALIQHILNGTSEELRMATGETLAYLQWLNRFADAELSTDKEAEG